MKKYAILAAIGVCLAGSVLFIVHAKKNSGNAVIQDSYSGFEENFSDSPETMKNENMEAAETDSAEETDRYVRIWTAEELVEMARSNDLYRLAQQYEIQPYKYRGEVPQDIKEMPEEMDRPVIYSSLCAMEEFCDGTAYTVLAAKFVSIFGDWAILFEREGEQYACAVMGLSDPYICDVVVWEEVVGNIEKSDALNQLAEQYAILQYTYRGDLLQDIKIMPEFGDLMVYAEGGLCAMEEFCGGTDFTVLAVEPIGYSWVILFEKDNEQYVCAIGEEWTYFTICDAAIWEELEEYIKIRTDEELVEIAKSKIQYQLAQQYELLYCGSNGETPQDEKELPDMDMRHTYSCLCAMEEFCGETDFTVLAIKNTSIFCDWLVLFEKDDERYVCADHATYVYICDVAIWEELVGDFANIDKGKE